jgi:uncharacterized protein YihD (DUF1040 family)
VRDPSRIETILKALEAAWLANPDLRLAQLILIACPSGVDPFYVEDNLLDFTKVKPLHSNNQ